MTRRDFLIGSAASGAVLITPSAFANVQGRSELKIGLVGCGGRGTGAAIDSFSAAPGIVLWAMGDLMPDRLEGSSNQLKEDLGKSYQVTKERMFQGWDAYKGVIASGVDVVILATPPSFRPVHLRAAIDAGKHVFMEKPVAVDVPGVKMVLESSAKAAQKKLCIVAGTQRRHDNGYKETIKRIHDGAIGDITACYAYWNQGALWMNPRQANWSDVEWQLRNWIYFTYLSGDHIVEQHIHNIDVCNWAMKGHPVKAVSLAGRQVRTDPAYGMVFDHFATEFEYENGVKMISMCRQQNGTAARVSEWVVGTKGKSDPSGRIEGANKWRFEGQRVNPYVQEHKDLIAAIRGGAYINDGKEVAESTMTAILGRMAGYTGQEVAWEDAMNSTESLLPANLAFGPKPVAPVPMPGITRLA